MLYNHPSTMLNVSAQLSRRFAAPLPSYIKFQKRNSRRDRYPHHFALPHYKFQGDGYAGLRLEKTRNLRKDLIYNEFVKMMQDNGSPSGEMKWKGMRQELRHGIEQSIERREHGITHYKGLHYSPSYVRHPDLRSLSRDDAQRKNKREAKKEEKRERQNKKRSPLIRPSDRSGGRPEPTPQYLTYASYPPFILPAPRVILLVIDLNGTLLFRPDKKAPRDFIARPHARQFLSYCLRTFKVVFWSSARLMNVGSMVGDLVASHQYDDIAAIMGREHFGLTEVDFLKRVMCYKRLTTVWKDKVIQSHHPEAGLGKVWDQSNTVLIDDSLEKGRSEPHNIIQIPEFMGGEERGYVLPQVHDYINELSRQANVSAYMRQSPFVLRDDFELRPDHTESVTKLGWNHGPKDLNWGK
ncbi:hypothetical protein ABKA04_001791 [Annulohypoxylon sp. FPYF3050]